MNEYEIKVTVEVDVVIQSKSLQAAKDEASTVVEHIESLDVVLAASVKDVVGHCIGKA